MTERQFEIPPGTEVVARDALAARQWELFLATGEGDARVWRTPPILGYRTWLAERSNAVEHDHALLTPAQSAALWRRVVAGSADAAGLIDVAAPAEWAAQAWDALVGWRIEPRSLAASADQPDFGAFLRWCADYRAALADRRWRDTAGLEDALGSDLRVERLVLADFDDDRLARPSTAAFLARLESAGTALARWQLQGTPAAAVRVSFPNEREELEAAVEWAVERLRTERARRIALIVPDLETRRTELDRIAAALGRDGLRVWDPGRADAGRDPAIGAALTAVELISPDAGFAPLGRWLRSLPLGDPRASVWARIEAGLRGGLLPQLGLREAYVRGGLRARLERGAPELVHALGAAFDAAGERSTRRTPSGWAAAWQRGLRALGWPLAPLAAPSRNAWESALAELRRLTPVLGPIGAADARAELERIVAALRVPAPLPTTGLFLFERPEDVGPGYDAAWVTGFTSARWPRPARLNPLLPRKLQQTHRMPWASPRDALERSRRVLAALEARVPELHVSYAEQVLDQPAEPSPMIASLPEAPRTPRVRVETAPPPLERLEDRPPPLPTTAILGGSGALNAQARAPLRAFCEHRLGARPLDPIGLGLPARLRGIAAHRALELLFRADAPSAVANSGADRLEAAAVAALEEIFGRTRRGLAALFRLEHERLVALLESFREAEARRAPFAIAALERRETITIGGHTLRVRIDRVDRLADGRLAVLDYKTGAAHAGDWLRERLRDVQVPLYAVHLGSGVAAAVLVVLDPAGTAYHGLWPDGAFPGRPRSLAASWPEQLATWRTQLEALAAEHAAGDCRIFPAELDPLRGAYAPLTRICEQLKLARAADGL